MPQPHDVPSRKTIETRVHDLIAELGLVKAARRLGISREAAMRVASGFGRPHSVAACGLALGILGPVRETQDAG